MYVESNISVRVRIHIPYIITTHLATCDLEHNHHVQDGHLAYYCWFDGAIKRPTECPGYPVHSTLRTNLANLLKPVLKPADNVANMAVTCAIWGTGPHNPWASLQPLALVAAIVFIDLECPFVQYASSPRMDQHGPTSKNLWSKSSKLLGWDWKGHLWNFRNVDPHTWKAGKVERNLVENNLFDQAGPGRTNRVPIWLKPASPEAIHTHTHRYTYIYICVCVCIYIYSSL